MLKRRLLPLVLAPCLLLASGGEPGLSLHYEYYQDANKVTSQTPGFDVLAKVAPNWSVSLDAEVDGVTGASRVSRQDPYDYRGVIQDKPVPGVLDGIAGASKYEFRVSQTAHVTYSHNGDIVSVGYYDSKEDDYFSAAPMLDLATDLFDRNTTLGVSLSYFNDMFVQHSITDSSGLVVGSGKKKLYSMQASVTQSFTPLTLGSVAVQRILSLGYLNKPYNPVLVPLPTPVYDSGAGAWKYYNDPLPEAMDNRKVALAFSGELVQGYTFIPNHLGSIRINYRYYTDTWGIQSHTIDNEWSQYLTENLYMRIRYRYYTQGAANFVYASYNGTEPFRTSDIKYYPFTSNMFGLKLGGNIPDDWQEGRWWVPARWNVLGNYMLRNTHGVSYQYQFFPFADTYYQFTVMTGVDYVF